MTVYYGLERGRELVKQYAPDFPEVDDPVDVFLASQDGNCIGGRIGFAYPKRINLCPKIQGPVPGGFLDASSGGTVDEAIHEYGHVLLMSGSPELTGGSLHEGIADIFTALVRGTPHRMKGALRWAVQGGFAISKGQCEVSRSLLNDCVLDTNTGSCTEDGASCSCQGAISGALWDAWGALSNTDAPSAKSIMANLVFNYMRLNHLEQNLDSSIALDFLVLDDDDGNLQNGTPHRDEICHGFE